MAEMIVSRQTLGSSWPASANWAAEIDGSVGLHVTLLRSHPLTCDRLDRAQAVAFNAGHLCRGNQLLPGHLFIQIVTDLYQSMDDIVN